MDAKRIAAEKAVEYIKSGITVGLGTGSTAKFAIEKLGYKIVSEGLQIKAVATSKASDALARSVNVPIIPFSTIDAIDITIDGADEVDEDLNLIKGGGGALLREKIVASNSKQLIIVADNKKLVKHLGKFPLPVEVIPFGYEMTIKKLEKLGCKPVLRKKDDEVFMTDNGNYIIDCSFGNILHPKQLHDDINAIVGVVENGLFINMANKVIIGFEDGHTNILERTQ
ncbi:MAG: ribose-5-phosphate isomerase RpiA [Ilyomonas sp.]